MVSDIWRECLYKSQSFQFINLLIDLVQNCIILVGFVYDYHHASDKYCNTSIIWYKPNALSNSVHVTLSCSAFSGSFNILFIFFLCLGHHMVSTLLDLSTYPVWFHSTHFCELLSFLSLLIGWTWVARVTVNVLGKLKIKVSKYVSIELILNINMINTADQYPLWWDLFWPV